MSPLATYFLIRLYIELRRVDISNIICVMRYVYNGRFKFLNWIERDIRRSINAYKYQVLRGWFDSTHLLEYSLLIKRHLLKFFYNKKSKVLLSFRHKLITIKLSLITHLLKSLHFKPWKLFANLLLIYSRKILYFLYTDTHQKT